jgi:hypothetical protein
MSEKDDTPEEESLEVLAEVELSSDDLDDDLLEVDVVADVFEAEVDVEEDEDDDVETPAPAAADDDDDDDDEVEADLDAILKVRIAAGDDDDEDDEDKPPVKKETPPGEAEPVQAKQDYEFLCPACFLLVNNSAVTHNECPHCGEPLGDMS